MQSVNLSRHSNILTVTLIAFKNLLKFYKKSWANSKSHHNISISVYFSYQLHLFTCYLIKAFIDCVKHAFKTPIKTFQSTFDFLSQYYRWLIVQDSSKSLRNWLGFIHSASIFSCGKSINCLRLKVKIPRSLKLSTIRWLQVWFRHINFYDVEDSSVQLRETNDRRADIIN